ncbi:Ig-like domain-containing protein [Pontiellaceae bacterium B1224]|nr:Ig-like domain-containing protein [Pontiellaceae bacterium B1224]
MRKRRLGIITALAGMLLAGTAQAVEFNFDLNLPEYGTYSNATEVATSLTYEGATFDVVYTIDSVANGSNSFVSVNTIGTLFGIGSDSDIATHYGTLEGNDGEGFSLTNLTIRNFADNGSGHELGDFTGLTFSGLSYGAAGNAQDGAFISFDGWTTNRAQQNLNGAEAGAGEVISVTGLANYVAPATNLYLIVDSVSSKNRFSIGGIQIGLDVPVEGNLPPVADAQDLITLPETALLITLTGSDPEGSNLTYNVVDYPDNGLFEGATNSWIYTPNSGFMATDSFSFTVNDGTDDSAPATVTITVENQLPVATAQSVNAYRNTPLAITLTGSDADGPSNLTYSVIVPTSPGTLNTNAGPNLIYTPQTGFTGEDGFVFKVNDGLADSEDATITINVLNNPPVADPKVAWTQPDTPVSIILSGYDPDESGSLSFNVATQPSGGVLSGAAPNLTYTPTNGFTGVDTFTYTANDGDNDGVPATVSISVSADGFALTFEDLNTGLSNNTLNVSGVPAEVTGVFVNSNDYLYSASFSGADIDGDGSNDTITFDVLVQAWTNGVITNTVASSNGGTYGTNGTAVIGTTNVPVVISDVGGLGWGVTSARMYAGESLEFTLMNINVNLTDPAKTGSAEGTGFVGTHLQEIGNAHSHQTVFGEGTGLYEVSWNDNALYVSGFPEVSDNLFVSQANNYQEAHNKAYNWRVRDVDFGIIVSVTKSGVPDILIDMNSGGDMVLSWEGAATFDVLTNSILWNTSGWGVSVSGASSPVTLPVGSEPALFYKLSE